MKHLSLQILVDLVQDRAITADNEKARQHLATCSHCRQELEQVRHLLVDLQEPALAAPQPELMQRLVTVFRRKQLQLAQRPLREATLQFDSWTKRAPLGVRGGMPQERQMLFSEGLFDIDLQIVEDTLSDVFSLRGQVLRSESSEEPETGDLEGIELRLTAADSDERRSLTDQLGRFTFSQITAGNYALRLILDDHDIVFESLDVRR